MNGIGVKIIYNIVVLRKNSIRMARLALAFLLILTSGYILAQDKKARVLIVLPDSSQFFSNAFYINDLAYIVDKPPEEVFKPYLQTLSNEISLYKYEEVEFIRCQPADLKQIQENTSYKTILNPDEEEYLGIFSPEGKDSLMKSMAEKYMANYVLSVNLYEMLSDGPIKFYGEPIEHVLHFDLFTSDMGVVWGGKYSTVTDEFLPDYLEWFYKDFSLHTIFWCIAHKTNKEDLVQTFTGLRNKFEKEKFGFAGKKGIGVFTGLGSPYGGLGIEFNYNFNHSWDINFGAGKDFSGFKIGMGAKHYVLGYKKLLKPFAAINYSYCTGNLLEINAEYDVDGSIINPDELSRYKIYPDHMVFLRGGVVILSKSGIQVSPSFGFSYPFAKSVPELVDGITTGFRKGFVNLVAPGGFDLGVAFYFYW